MLLAALMVAVLALALTELTRPPTKVVRTADGYEEVAA